MAGSGRRPEHRGPPELVSGDAGVWAPLGTLRGVLGLTAPPLSRYSSTMRPRHGNIPRSTAGPALRDCGACRGADIGGTQRGWGVGPGSCRERWGPCREGAAAGRLRSRREAQGCSGLAVRGCGFKSSSVRDVPVGLPPIAHVLPVPQLPGGGDPVTDVGACCGASGAARGPSVPPPGRGVSGALPWHMEILGLEGCIGQGGTQVLQQQCLLWAEEGGQAAVTLVVSSQQQPQTSPMIPALSPFLPLAVALG